MRINNNVGMWAIRYLQNLQTQQNTQQQSLAQSTIPLNQNISSNVIAERIRSQVNGYREAMVSTYNTIGMMNTAEGGLQSISSNLQRMRELAIQASNGTLSDSERSALQKEFTQLSQGINKVVEQTKYNNQRVLGGEIRNMQVQLGPNEGQNMKVTLPSMDIKSLGLESVNLNSTENAQNALKAIDQAISNVSTTRNYIGSVNNRLESAARNLSETMINLTSSVSILTGTDMARTTMEWIRTQLQSRATIGVLSQSNVNSSNVLRLLG
ncbi:MULTISPECIES: flagellin [Fervidobacterium]|uniref:Flagellin n=1 Tax=Fervidobacterium nodosum (strain ATCC 35602 / DSM 5306 / Rt17-B1) TaxID=381764 RepID=A7HNB1_FERNB|nr:MULTISPECIES: flagellin [Fervidobacterium]ABS61394.1 flagellin domain protein [Fervidobacterium nodosum Rt17-B1]KAF2962188.1 flagellin [Fervidobacterium sp. 2310opik-2]PHJ14521.1 flagellin [Fervidobacterium sp. SC_NGM5_G05]